LALFLSRYEGRIDRKGRVLVPAPFRAAVADQRFGGVVCYPSPVELAIEGCDLARIELLANSIDSLNPFSAENGAFATTILGKSHQLAFDPEGRVSLPEALVAFAGIAGAMWFVGLGKTFRIWSPERLAAYEREAEKLARNEAGRLALRPQGVAT